MTKIIAPGLLFEVMPDMIGIKDHEYGTIQYNPAGYKFLKKKPTEIDGKKCYEMMGRSTPCDICALSECYQTKKTAVVEKYFDDQDKWLIETAYPVLDEKGRIERVIQHYRDITGRKQVEMRLLMLERALNQSIDGIAVADMEGVNQFVNPAWAQTHGYTVEEMLDKSLYEFHPEDQLRENVIPFFNKVLKYGSNRGESEHTKKDGTLFATYMMASIIKDDEGNPLGFVGTVRDISELKRAERELEKYRDHLESLVKERTVKLTEANDELTKALSEIKDLKDRLEAENINLREVIKQEHDFEEIVGQSDPLKYVLYRVKEVAPTDATVLILGQSGTGKELVARAIHDNSSRKSRPLVKVDCSVLPASLIESELFGHEKGAFSGALQQRKGRFEVANGSTLFLDEIGELALGLQGKLLRVLEYGEFERLGSSKTLRTDVRIIAATNRNLKEEVEKGRFREDLWYRLNVFSVKIPPLKDRREDVPILVEWFVEKFSRRLGKTIKAIPKKTMNALQAHHWPGNIRELSNVIESAMICCHDETLRIPDLPGTGRNTSGGGIVTMEEMEKNHILNAIKTCNWQIEGKNGAAAFLGLNPGTLRGRMRKYAIRRP